MTDDPVLSVTHDRGGRTDPQQGAAAERLQEMFGENRSTVYFSRQLEVQHEATWFHWITNRALTDLIARGVIDQKLQHLSTGTPVKLMWHRSHRYHRRDINRVVKLIEEYADPNIGAALGLQGEAMVLEGLARRQFVMLGRNTNRHGSGAWIRTDHDLDFIFERDGIAYGVEVKNTLGYMPYDELKVKIEMCRELGLKPLFAVRMLPKAWVNEINNAGGFALILKYQLYPWAHRDLARRVREELGLPVDAPRALQEGTIDRFVQWHERLRESGI